MMGNTTVNPHPPGRASCLSVTRAAGECPAARPPAHLLTGLEFSSRPWGLVGSGQTVPGGLARRRLSSTDREEGPELVAQAERAQRANERPQKGQQGLAISCSRRCRCVARCQRKPEIAGHRRRCAQNLFSSLLTIVCGQGAEKRDEEPSGPLRQGTAGTSAPAHS